MCHLCAAEHACDANLTPRQDCTLVFSSISLPGFRYENSVDCLQWLPLGEEQRTMLLVSAGGDGVLRVWSVGATGHLMCTLQGATGHLETVKDLCIDEELRHLVIADSSGHIRMLDISQLDASSPDALTRSFKQVFPFHELLAPCSQRILGGA